MTNSLRKLRWYLINQSNLKKYFLYAIGEIILIVVGILVAIQIDNSQNKKEKNKLKFEYYNSLVADFQMDIGMYNSNIDFSNKRTIEIDSIFNIINTNKELQKIKNHTYFSLLNVKLHQSTLTDIISSGNSEILDKSIRNKLFDLKTDTETYMENLQANNMTCNIVISRFHEKIDTSYPTLRKSESELAKDWVFNPNSETFLRYTNMLNQLNIIAKFNKVNSERILIKTQNLIDTLNYALLN
jgi:hypothetical protein